MFWWGLLLASLERVMLWVQELGDAGLLATVECPEPPAVTAEQLAGLSVLDAVCHESMRLLTPEPFGGFRQLAEHTNVRLRHMHASQPMRSATSGNVA